MLNTKQLVKPTIKKKGKKMMIFNMSRKSKYKSVIYIQLSHPWSAALHNFNSFKTSFGGGFQQNFTRDFDFDSTNHLNIHIADAEAGRKLLHSSQPFF